NWKVSVRSSSASCRMIRESLNFLQARANACRGCSARATDSSSSASRSASSNAGKRTAIPGQVQHKTSPRSLVPIGSMNGPEDVRSICILLSMDRERDGQLQGQDALDRGIAGDEGRDQVDVVADRRQIAGVATDDERRQPGSN